MVKKNSCRLATPSLTVVWILAAIGLRREKFVWRFLLWKKKWLTSYLSITQVFEWRKAFSKGREVVENLPHASRPSTSVNDDNIEKVKKIVLENRRVGIRKVAEALNISYGSTQYIVVHVLGMKRVAARLVPEDLNF